MESKKLFDEILSGVDAAGYNDEKLHAAYTLLGKIISNIISNPAEPKFKTIKSDNATLKAKLFCIQEMREILIELGFFQDGDTFHFLDDAEYLIMLQIHLEAIQKHIKKIERKSMSKEELEKELIIEARKREIEAEMKRKLEAEAKLKDQMKLDQKDNKDRVVRDSKAVKRDFGTKITRYGDIGIDLCKQKGG